MISSHNTLMLFRTNEHPWLPNIFLRCRTVHLFFLSALQS
uniref:Uncharacterized protein n=1 Tax=Arundo donax TaxID=35708 RepID=A0A0A9FHC5_ARUDO